jgi:hypothetical protein
VVARRWRVVRTWGSAPDPPPLGVHKFPPHRWGYGGANGGAVELEISAETVRKRSTDDLRKYHANGHDETDPDKVDHPA